jgi:hypothetical protein
VPDDDAARQDVRRLTLHRLKRLRAAQICRPDATARHRAGWGSWQGRRLGRGQNASMRPERGMASAAGSGRGSGSSLSSN